MKGFLWSLSAFFFLLGCGSIDYLLKNPDYIALPAGMTAVFTVLCIYFGYRAKTYDGRAIDRHHKLELKDYSADEAELIETSWQRPSPTTRASKRRARRYATASCVNSSP